MCGIVGAVSQRNVINILLDGLKKLEYRGYDSSGVAVLNKNKERNSIGQYFRPVTSYYNLLEANRATLHWLTTG